MLNTLKNQVRYIVRCVPNDTNNTHFYTKNQDFITFIDFLIKRRMYCKNL